MKISFFSHFDQADPAGLLFYGHYFSFSHQAIEKYLLARDVNWAEWFKSSEYAVPIVHTSADYKKPLPAGEHFDIDVEISHLGQSSIEFSCQFLLSDEVTAIIKSVHVFVNKETQNKMNIPQNLVGKLQTL